DAGHALRLSLDRRRCPLRPRPGPGADPPRPLAPPRPAADRRVVDPRGTGSRRDARRPPPRRAAGGGLPRPARYGGLAAARHPAAAGRAGVERRRPPRRPGPRAGARPAGRLPVRLARPRLSGTALLPPAAPLADRPAAVAAGGGGGRARGVGGRRQG